VILPDHRTERRAPTRRWRCVASTFPVRDASRKKVTARMLAAKRSLPLVSGPRPIRVVQRRSGTPRLRSLRAECLLQAARLLDVAEQRWSELPTTRGASRNSPRGGRPSTDVARSVSGGLGTRLRLAVTLTAVSPPVWCPLGFRTAQSATASALRRDQAEFRGSWG
jgi:hypothetical protein